LYSDADAVNKMPSCIIEVEYVDDAGQLWISIPAMILLVDEKFPVQVSFFKKGVCHYMKVTGYAYMVTDPEEKYLCQALTPKIASLFQQNNTVIKIAVQHVEYQHLNLEENAGIKQSLKTLVYSFFNFYKPKTVMA
jgi:hypothetical protein